MEFDYQYFADSDLLGPERLKIPLQENNITKNNVNMVIKISTKTVENIRRK